MADITPLSPNVQQQNLFGNNSAILGKDDFLKILVAQLSNQDPTSPMEADQFAVQLAQFSSVEQLQNISATLDDSINTNLLLNQAINNTMATTLIGKEVLAYGNSANLSEGKPTELHYKLAGAAESVEIQIRDEAGNVVRTVKLDNQLEGSQSFTWDGETNQGETAPPGKYTFSVKATNADGQAVGVDTYVSGIINGIRYEDGSAILRVGDHEISLAEVIEINEVPATDGTGDDNGDDGEDDGDESGE